jgi:hypothetical protein
MANNVTIFPSGVTADEIPQILFEDAVGGQFKLRYVGNELRFSAGTSPLLVVISSSGVTTSGTSVSNPSTGVWAGETRMINTIGEWVFKGHKVT